MRGSNLFTAMINVGGKSLRVTLRTNTRLYEPMKVIKNEVQTRVALSSPASVSPTRRDNSSVPYAKS